MKFVTGLACAAACVILVAGCSSQTAPPRSTPSLTAKSPSSISQAEAAALADKKVTYAEYQAGWRRYVACDAKAGYVVKLVGETNEVYSGTVPAAAVNSGVDTKCYDYEFKGVDQIWQVSREDTSAQAADYRACLTKAGITPDKTEDDMYFQLRKAGIDPNKCIAEQSKQ